MLRRFNRIAAREEDGVNAVILLDADVSDFGQMCEIEAEIATSITTSRSRSTVIDMANVAKITSVVLLPLIGIRQRVEERRGRLVLCNLSAPVAHVLRASQLAVESRPHARRLVTADDLDAALTRVTEPQIARNV